MKKVRVSIVLLLLLCVVQGMLPLPAGAAENPVDLVDNGDFARCFSDGSPGAWWLSDTTQMQMQSAGGFEDSAYLQLSGTSSNYASQGIGGISGGTSYTFSAYTRCVSPALPVLKIEWYALEDDGTPSFLSATEHVFYDVTVSWETVTLAVEAPAGASKGTLLIRKIGAGAVCWDAVRLTGALEKRTNITSELKPAVEGTVDCIVNGGFEKTEDGEAISWAKSSGNYFSLETVRPYNGNTSLRLESNDASASPWLRQVYTGVEGGSTYQLSLWAASMLSTGRFSVKLEFYNSTACSAATWILDTIAVGCETTNGIWKQVVIPIRMPDDCKSIAVYPRLFDAVGRVYLDDISLVKTETRSPLSLATDAIFYYSDRTEDGVATLESTAFYTEGSIAEAEFSFLDTDGTVQKTEKAVFTNGKAEFRFPLSLFKEERVEYTVTAKAYSASGSLVVEKSVPVYKYPRPGMLDKDGNYRIGGEVFTPVISYHHHPDDYDKAAAMGVNVVQSYGMSGTAILDEAAKHGIKVLMVLYDGMKPAGHPDNIEKTKALVEEVKNHSALFGYAVMDEPYFNYTAPEEWLHTSYQIIRNIDTVHPVYLCENTREHLKDSLKYADVIAIDPYIAGNSDSVLTHVLDETAYAVENTGNGKPVYALLQAFDFKEYFPTGEELRHQLYQAFLSGARGVGYYCFDDAKDGKDLDETEIWDTICSFASEELPEAAYGFSQGNACTKILGENADAAFWREGDETTLLVLNKTDAMQSGTLTVADLPENADVVRIIGDGVGTLNGTAFSYQIRAGAAVRYTLSGAGTPWNGNLLLDSSAEALSVIEKTVYNLREGERYAFSFRAQCSTPEKAPRVRLDFSNSANTASNTVFFARAVLDGIGANPAYGTTEWQSYEVTFRVPEGANQITLLLGSVSGGVYASPALRREAEGLSFYCGAEAVETVCQVEETADNASATKSYALASIRGEAAAQPSEADGVLYRVHTAKEKTLLFVPVYTETEEGMQSLLAAEVRRLEKGDYACILQPLSEKAVFVKPMRFTEAMQPAEKTEEYRIQ